MQETIHGSATQSPVRRVLSASSLRGDRVRNSQGEDLGKIEEIMIDLETGGIAYAVLSFGGLFGIGDKLFAVPWTSLEVDEFNHELLLNADKETLESAEGFDKDNWPDMADPAFGALIHNHFGAKPYWDRAEIPTRSFEEGGVRAARPGASQNSSTDTSDVARRVAQSEMPQGLRTKGIDVTDFPGRSKDDDLKTADPSRRYSGNEATRGNGR